MYIAIKIMGLAAPPLPSHAASRHFLSGAVGRPRGEAAAAGEKGEIFNQLSRSIHPSLLPSLGRPRVRPYVLRLAHIVRAEPFVRSFVHLAALLIQQPLRS